MHFSIFIAIYLFGSSSSALKCPDSHPNVVQFSSNKCFYVSNYSVPKISRETAENACGLLGEGSYRWYLPKFDSETRDQFLADAVLNITNLTTWTAWVGLYRDAPIDMVEPFNMTQWGDKSKWRWSIDGTNLESSFPNTSPPWLPQEPTNTEYTKNTGYAGDMERCVVAELKKNRKFTIPKWYDMCCELRAAQHIGGPVLHDYVLICESATVTHEADGKAMANRQITTIDCAGERRWQWLLLGMVLGSVVATFAVIGAYYFKQKNRGQKLNEEIAIEYRGGENTDGQQSGLAIPWSNEITDDRQKFF